MKYNNIVSCRRINLTGGRNLKGLCPLDKVRVNSVSRLISPHYVA